MKTQTSVSFRPLIPRKRLHIHTKFRAQAKQIRVPGKSDSTQREIELVKEEHEWWLDYRRRVGGIDGG